MSTNRRKFMKDIDGYKIEINELKKQYLEEKKNIKVKYTISDYDTKESTNDDKELKHKDIINGKTEKNRRRLSSLGALTIKFLDYSETLDDNIIDLNDFCDTNEIKKRRVYDITNVLEGIDIIRKPPYGPLPEGEKYTNKVQIINEGIYSYRKIPLLKDELEKINEDECHIDKEIIDSQNKLKKLIEDNSQLLYIDNKEDIEKKLGIYNYYLAEGKTKEDLNFIQNGYNEYMVLKLSPYHEVNNDSIVHESSISNDIDDLFLEDNMDNIEDLNFWGDILPNYI